jgi:YhcH/YjgK/YiaL family protein
MILDTLANADRYLALHPLFAQAFGFLRRGDLELRGPGVHPVLDERIFVIVEDCEGRTRADARLECHRRYIDIQLVLEGVDEMGWRPLAACADPATEYDADRDIRFFNDAPASWIATPPGSFCLFFPDDAHAPLVSARAGTAAGQIRKVIVKVAVDGTP